MSGPYSSRTADSLCKMACSSSCTLQTGSSCRFGTKQGRLRTQTGRNSPDRPLLPCAGAGRPLQVFHVGFPHPLKAVAADHLHDASEGCPDVRRHRFKRRFHALVQIFNAPTHTRAHRFSDERQAFPFRKPFLPSLSCVPCSTWKARSSSCHPLLRERPEAGAMKQTSRNLSRIDGSSRQPGCPPAPSPAICADERFHDPARHGPFPL